MILPLCHMEVSLPTFPYPAGTQGRQLADAGSGGGSGGSTKVVTDTGARGNGKRLWVGTTIAVMHGQLVPAAVSLASYNLS